MKLTKIDVHLNKTKQFKCLTNSVLSNDTVNNYYFILSLIDE